jgi:hypothetical protein
MGTDVCVSIGMVDEVPAVWVGVVVVVVVLVGVVVTGVITGCVVAVPPGGASDWGTHCPATHT